MGDNDTDTDRHYLHSAKACLETGVITSHGDLPRDDVINKCQSSVAQIGWCKLCD